MSTEGTTPTAESFQAERLELTRRLKQARWREALFFLGLAIGVPVALLGTLFLGSPWLILFAIIPWLLTISSPGNPAELRSALSELNSAEQELDAEPRLA